MASLINFAKVIVGQSGQKIARSRAKLLSAKKQLRSWPNMRLWTAEPFDIFFYRKRKFQKITRSREVKSLKGGENGHLGQIMYFPFRLCVVYFIFSYYRHLICSFCFVLFVFFALNV